MEVWFSSKPIHSFELFSNIHLFMIIAYLFGMILLLIYSKRTNAHIKIANSLRWVFLVLLFTSETSYQIWGIVNHNWNPPEFLPFQLCSMAGIITMVALITKNIRIIKLTLFIAILPSFLAVLTPELHHGFPQFRFWQFFIHHLVLSWAAFFLVLNKLSKVSFRDTIVAYMYLLSYAAIIGFFINPIFNANYLFLARTSSANTPLNYLGDGFWYYLNLCVIGLLAYLFIYGLLRLLSTVLKGKGYKAK